MLGLVAEFSDKPFVEGSESISPMRGVLHTGHVCEQNHGLATVEAMEDNLDKLRELWWHEWRRLMAHLFRRERVWDRLRHALWRRVVANRLD
jgi:hypothetical protein